MVKVNISIDDVSPHPDSSIKVLERCFELINIFPKIKFTLFVPIAYWRTIGAQASEYPFWIQNYQDFVNVLKSLPKDNFELCYHGLFHGIPGRSNNDELQSISYEDALKIIEMMFTCVSMAGLINDFKGIIRPPAWRMSPEAIRAFSDKGFKLFALSPDEYALQTYKSEQLKQKTVYYNCCPPFKQLNLFEQTEIVYHACNWDKNFLSKELTQQLIEFLTLHKNDIEFSFIEDLWVNQTQ